MHLDDEQLQRLLHGELTPPAEALLRGHVVACEHCHSRVEQAAREEKRVLELLRTIDHPPPHASMLAIAARARGRRRRWGERAAAIIVALATAGVAYAAPGSPFPDLLRRLIASEERAPQAPAPVRPPPRPESTGGITVAPGDRFTIAFAATQAGGLATVSLTDGEDVAVRAVGGNPAFASDVDRLSIDNAKGDASFEIEIPRNAPWVEIRIGDRRVLLKTAARVQTDGRRDVEGRYVIRLSRSGS